VKSVPAGGFGHTGDPGYEEFITGLLSGLNAIGLVNSRFSFLNPILNNRILGWYFPLYATKFNFGKIKIIP